jgi:glycosyltransferase involved in cell wall biosynthesis
LTRVLHLCTSDVRGGAARGAYWLHSALRERGVDSRMLVGRKYSSDRNVSTPGGALAPITERVRDRLDALPLRRYAKTDESYWTVGWVPRHIKKSVESLDPDVIHLHWIGGGFLPVSALAGLGRPLVWTLRDMWAFTGGCHYSGTCHRFEVACGACPQLNSGKEHDLSRIVRRRKERAWVNLDLTLVPISRWLAECVRQSGLFPGRPIEIIPNGLDTRVFRPTVRSTARAAWDLPPDKRYILFGALGAVQDQRKGYEKFVEALRHLARACWSTRAEILVFGDLAPDNAAELAIPARFLGHINDDRRLAALYAAADVMVVPSLQEAFGKTVIEAMACGTPVVAFDGTGPADIITHRKTGYLAKPFDARDLATGIAWCLAAPDHTEGMSQAARARAVSHFDISIIADRYTDLYRRLQRRAA